MTPLLQATLAWVCGVIPGLLAPGALAPAAAAAALLLAGAALAGQRHERWLIAGFLIAGLASGATAAVRARSACAAHWHPGRTLVLRGHVTAAPVPGRATGFQPAGRVCRDALRISLPRNAAGIEPGAPLAVRATWQPFAEGTRWPVAPARRGVLRASAVAVDAQGHTARGARLRARTQLALRQLLPRRHGVAEALILARTEALDPDLRDTFVAAGLAHLLAISGAHVVVFAGAVLLLLRLARIPLRSARLAALVLIGVYVGGIGAPPAAARAAVQFALVMAALLLQRPAHAWTVMAAAALALLVLQPLNALDAGFQLSFAGVAGLLAGRRRMAGALPAWWPAALRDGVATGLAATAATFPIAALHFGQFAPVGLPATMVASPVIALALPGLALLVLLYPVLPAVAAWLAPGVELLLGTFLAIARLAARVPGGHFAVSASTLAGLLLGAVAVLLALAHVRGRGVGVPPESPQAEHGVKRSRVLRALQAVAAAAAVLTWAPRLAPGNSYVELHVIDVGQGDAIGIRTPHGRWLLVDTGVRGRGVDMGARRVAPYLLRHGVRQLDVLVLTHSDADHTGGAASVLRILRVGAIADPGLPDASSQYLETLRAGKAEHARWLAPRAGSEALVDGVRLSFLHPSATSLDAPQDPNEYSLVFRLGFGRFGALFTGDAPRVAEELLVRQHGRALAATVLKVGHHGSRTATSPDLLDAVDPSLALISVGKDNRYGHPDPDVVARLVLHGARVLRTDQHGSVVIRAWRSGRVKLGVER